MYLILVIDVYTNFLKNLKTLLKNLTTSIR